MSEIDLREFYKSISDELDAIKNRVRNLIGDSHWGKDGEYKEAILKNVIKRFLPKNFSVGTGFVLAHYITKSHITSQIDIIVYDNTLPLLFQEGDFVILTPQSVRAIIEVKTRVNSVADFEEITRTLIDNALMIKGNQAKHLQVNDAGLLEDISSELFVGLFSYDCNRKIDGYVSKLRDVFVEKNKPMGGTDISRHFINNLCLSRDNYLQIVQHSADDLRLTSYRMENLAQSYFVVSLLKSLNFLSIYSNFGAWIPFDEDEFEEQSIDLL